VGDELERAGFMKTYQEKKLKNLVYGLSGVSGDAATRIEAFTASTGVFAYGRYPDIDGLFREGLGLIADYPWSAPYEDVKLEANR